MSIKFEIYGDLTAFKSTGVIGSKVIDTDSFMAALTSAVDSHDSSGDRAEGQHFVHLPESAWSSVSAGVGHKSKDPDDYVVRTHRGQPGMFLRRDKAAEVEGLACVVYTRDAYLNDPDIADEPEEEARIKASDCTHVIVAVLAFAGPKAALTPYRLVYNLAGGNNEVNDWDMFDVRTNAKETLEYWNTWAVVAD